MRTSNALVMLALGGAITADVVGTFAIEHAALRRNRRLWVAAAGVFLASLALFALALEGIPTAVAEASFVALGTTAVAVIVARGVSASPAARGWRWCCWSSVSSCCRRVAAMREPVAASGRTRLPFLVGWGALWSAIALDVGQIFLLDGSEGLRQPSLLPVTAAGFFVELGLFARAVRCLSPVIAYAAYGTTPAIVTILSIGFFGEALTPAKLAGVGVVTVGIILLATGGTAEPRSRCAEPAAR